MTSIPLRMGELAVPGWVVGRSGLRWLYDDGHMCRPGEVVAYCNVGLHAERPPDGGLPFPEEGHDLQVAFATPLGGRLRIARDTSRGGFLDRLTFYQTWIPDAVVGQLEYRPGERPWGTDGSGKLRTLFLAGRRMVDSSEDRSGILTGWFNRARAWWNDGEGDHGTLLSYGICEQLGVIRGERHAFFEMFELAPGPAHVVFVPDDTLVPCVRIVLEQLARTPEENAAIAADLAQSLLAGPAPAPADWLFAGALLTALLRSPLTDDYEILAHGGVRRAGPADAVVLSINSEAAVLFRHKRLGYALHVQDFRLENAGPAVTAWLRRDFERVPQSTEDVHRDYLALIDAARARTNPKFLILNAMSTSGREDISNYAGFDRPLSGTLETVRRKEMNLMLHDLARERGVAIVDADAIAAEIGASANLPDGIHQSGVMQAEQRAEIVRILRAEGVRGFGSPALAAT